jgi:hypothetical protein
MISNIFLYLALFLASKTAVNDNRMRPKSIIYESQRESINCFKS